MNWKTKAKIQNCISIFPSSLSYATYYWMQRRFGGWRILNPENKLKIGIETWQRIQDVGHEPIDKSFFEVGTGRVPLVPLAYWLMGAKETITIDVNPYLKEELIEEGLQYIADHNEQIQNLFGARLQPKRMEALLHFIHNSPFSINTFLDLTCIKYLAPADAANTKLPEQSVDFHTSYTVFEHIPLEILRTIIDEGNRIISLSLIHI